MADWRVTVPLGGGAPADAGAWLATTAGAGGGGIRLSAGRGAIAAMGKTT
jgi:hypothetical protein